MGSIRSEGRHQTDLLPETIDAYIGAENPERVWDAFVEPFGLVRALAADPGRPGDDPRALWRL
jgi:hypothetical protein